MGRFRTPQAFLEYGTAYAVHQSLWREGVRFAFGPLQNEGKNPRNYAVSSITSLLGPDTPKYRPQSRIGGTFMACEFATKDDYLQIIKPPLAGASRISLSVWVYASSFTNPDHVPAVFVETTSAEGYTRWGLYLTNRKPRLIWRDAAADPGGSAVVFDAGSTLSSNRWYHLVVTWDSLVDQHQIWIDGRLDATSSTAGGALGTSASYGAWLGRLPHSSQIANLLKGFLASPSLFLRVITPAEIAVLARHPLAAYEVAIPRYHFVPSGVSFNPSIYRDPPRHVLGAPFGSALGG
jgi:hypothetical protein